MYLYLLDFLERVVDFSHLESLFVVDLKAAFGVICVLQDESLQFFIIGSGDFYSIGFLFLGQPHSVAPLVLSALRLHGCYFVLDQLRAVHVDAEQLNDFGFLLAVDDDVLDFHVRIGERKFIEVLVALLVYDAHHSAVLDVKLVVLKVGGLFPAEVVAIPLVSWILHFLDQV